MWRGASLLPPQLAAAAFLLLLLGVAVADATFPEYLRRGPKRRCFQCNMPYECESGSCFGDVCVKSLAAPVSTNNGYVSKGCENITANAMMMYRYEDSCKLETVFGVETMVCYCSDTDFCNAGDHGIHGFGVVLLALVAAALR